MEEHGRGCSLNCLDTLPQICRHENFPGGQTKFCIFLYFYFSLFWGFSQFFFFFFFFFDIILMPGSVLVCFKINFWWGKIVLEPLMIFEQSYPWTASALSVIVVNMFSAILWSDQLCVVLMCNLTIHSIRNSENIFTLHLHN